MAANQPSFSESFDKLIQKIDEALQLSSKMTSLDFQALEKMNQAATVYYKNQAVKLATITKQTKKVCDVMSSTALPQSNIVEIWERAHRMEAIVDALDKYTSRLETELFSNVGESSQ